MDTAHQLSILITKYLIQLLYQTQTVKLRLQQSQSQVKIYIEGAMSVSAFCLKIKADSLHSVTCLKISLGTQVPGVMLHISIHNQNIYICKVTCNVCMY